MLSALHIQSPTSATAERQEMCSAIFAGGLLEQHLLEGGVPFAGNDPKALFPTNDKAASGL